MGIAPAGLALTVACLGVGKGRAGNGAATLFGEVRGAAGCASGQGNVHEE